MRGTWTEENKDKIDQRNRRMKDIEINVGRLNAELDGVPDDMLKEVLEKVFSVKTRKINSQVISLEVVRKKK